MGATAEKRYLRRRSGAAAERSYPANEVRGDGRQELPAYEVGAAAERSYPMSKDWWLGGRRRA